MLAETSQPEYSTRPTTPESHNRTTQEFPFVSIQLAAAFAGAVLVCFALRQWDLRASEPATDIISRMVLEGVHPFSDYVKYLAALLAAGAAVAGTAMLPMLHRWTTWATVRHVSTAPSARGPASAREQRTWRRLAAVAAVLLVGSWALNRAATPKDITGPLEDTFHEGEHISWQPTIESAPQPLSEMMLTHGFGLDVVPMWVADAVGGDNRLVLARLVLALFGALTALGALWVLIEALKLARLPRRPALVICFAVFALLLLLEWNPTNRRDLVFLPQLALTLRMYRHARAGRRRLAFLEAAVVGISIPGAFLYTYDRAIHFVLVVTPFLIGSLIPSAAECRRLVPATLALLAGATVGVLVLLVTVGASEIWSIVGQLRYWSETMKYIFGVSLFREGRRDIIVFSTAVSAQVVAIALLIRRLRSDGFAAAWHRNSAVVLLVGAAMVHMRIVLDMSDMFHLEWAVAPSMILLVVLLATSLASDLSVVASVAPGERRAWKLRVGAVGTVLVLASVAAGTPARLLAHVNPARTAQSVAFLSNALSTPDSRIVKPDYQAATAYAARNLRPSDCFYTLTSEATWYYLVDRPTCSEFHQLLNARTRPAQRAVVADLHNKRVPLVLFQNAMWSNHLHGVSVFESNPIVLRYVFEHFRPAAAVQGHWFWRRSSEPWRFANPSQPIGTVTRLPALISVGDSVRALGTLAAAQVDSQAAIFVSVETRSGHQFVATGRSFEVGPSGVTWSANLPVAALPHGAQRLHFWLWNASARALVPVGSPQRVAVHNPKAA